MTRLVVTTDADVDASDILDYLGREADGRVAGITAAASA
jgi:hypothetical protein